MKDSLSDKGQNADDVSRVLTADHLTYILRLSYIRIFFAALVPLMLSQGPAAPAQFLLACTQVVCLSLARVYTAPDASDSSVFPAMLFWASSAGLHFYVSGTDVHL